ncbi:hypothetical protein PHYSODRAFT_261029 [Phytophthora sojae]|uniref:Uncharacterized protein n=1 Tax=Phytophthora sojae (strain P6497) TaxID=1094619 RepID=G5A9Y0_PHYSP|nr:hypothetical protein PHYSODRAFT_261029 [Phytophthora sojae]EGZ07410.1 hypothetical protein PHYSODRAFT_261029 [Phytophthora sojae]|eukprot:XP_009536976.1 hypothetical protein PHYSODRAFT_261029 [Phytophthora sojae]
MERKDRKRRAVEAAPPPELVSPTITNLVSTIRESNVGLKDTITSLHEQISNAKKQLTDVTEECAKYEDEVKYLHPDAVLDRVRMKLWHHGDLGLFRDVIDPNSRESVVGGGRSLYFSESAPKKGGLKPPMSNSWEDELSPKHENEDEEVTIPALPPMKTTAPDTDEVDARAGEKDDGYVEVQVPRDEEDQVKTTPEEEAMTTNGQEITASEPLEKELEDLEQEITETELMNGSPEV